MVIVPLVVLTASSASQIPAVPGQALLLLGGLIVAAVGLADDRWGLSPLFRFCVYLVAASVPVIGGCYVHELQWPGGPALSLGWMAVPFTLLWIVGLTNAYNFMDGIDGIAGIQAVVAAGTAASIATWQGNYGLALFAAVLAGGVAGFLIHNWPPARVFMGDVGSAYLGYTFAGLAVVFGDGAGAPFPFALWLILLAPFLFDSALTLVWRIARRERWYEPHRQHLYQRLIRQGWSHLSVTSLYLCADLVLSAVVVAHVAFGVGGETLALVSLLPLLCIFALVRWVETRHAANSGCSSPLGER